MGSSVCDDLILEVGSSVISSEEYAEFDWAGIAVVGNFFDGEQSMNGYVYLSDGDFTARTPSFAALRKIRELREAMKQEKGETWHQCLIHVTRPDLKLNIQFEYEDPRRWKPKKVSMDMSDHAEFLKPPSLSVKAQ